MNNPAPPPLPHTLPYASASAGLSPEHVEQISAARRLGRIIRRAQHVALFDAWTTGIFGALTVAFCVTSPLQNLAAILLGLGMIAIAILHLRWARRLEQLHPASPRRLAIHTLALALLLTGYATWNLLLTLRQPPDLPAELTDPQLAAMLGNIGNVVQRLYLLVYAAMIVIALLGGALTALYYRTRQSPLERYLRDTPPWILDLQRAGMSL